MCWRSLVISNKYRLTDREKEAEIIAKSYKIMVHNDIDAKVKTLRNTIDKVNNVLIRIQYKIYFNAFMA